KGCAACAAVSRTRIRRTSHMQSSSPRIPVPWLRSSRTIKGLRIPFRPQLEELESRILLSGDIFVARDGTVNVFTHTATPGSVVRVDPATGNETTLWSGTPGTPQGAHSLAVDAANNVYFIGSPLGPTGLFRIDALTTGFPEN